MNGIQPNLFKDFSPPQAKSLLSLHFITSLATNIFSFGTYGCYETINRRFRFCILEREKEYLLNKISDLDNRWKELEGNLTNLMLEFNTLPDQGGGNEVAGENQQLDALKERVQALERTTVALNLEQLAFIPERIEPPSIGSKEVVLSIMTFMAKWIFTLSTLGFYSAYQSHILRDRIKILEAENQHLKSQVQPRINQHNSSLRAYLDIVSKVLKDRGELIALRATNTVQQVEELRGRLEDAQQNFRADIDRLENTCRAGREANQALIAVNELLTQQNRTLGLQINRLNATQYELPALRQQVAQLQIRVNQPQNDQRLVHLRTRLVPISSKHILTGNALRNALFDIQGEAGVGDAHEIEQSSWSEYAKRYNELETASDVFRKGFAYALEQMFAMAKAKDQKIKLNASLKTPQTEGGRRVFCFLAFDLLKGGHPSWDCQDHPELILNNKGVKMVSAQPENVWNGNDRYSMTLRFTNRDDFTPGEKELANTTAAFGPDPITAKLLLAKLSDEEKNHLFNLLMEPVIEDNHPDYQNTLKAINEMSPERQDQIYTLRDLIINMGVVLQIKFKDLVDLQWKTYLVTDEDDQHFCSEPFIKKRLEEEIKVVEVVEDEALEPHQVVPWQLNLQILAVMKDGLPEQQDFADLMMSVKQEYQVYFKNLNSKLLKKPMIVGQEVVSVEREQIAEQYYLSHQLIGLQGCLFSNLLWILMTDKNHVTKNNILKLKKAMAYFLDNPDNAARFESALKNDHNCTVKQYQGWLRGEVNGVFIANSQLTPLQIEIAAYTLEVKIALFTPPYRKSVVKDYSNTKCVVDQYGRLVPVNNIEGHYFGPNTNEVFFMMAENNNTYYALFPKLDFNRKEIADLRIEAKDLEVIEKIEGYWRIGCWIK